MEELIIRVISTDFKEMCFHENAFPQKVFQHIAFYKMQEKHNGGKESKPRLLLISVGCIARQ